MAAAFPELSFDELAQFSIGRRDAYLLTLREWLFGPQLVSLADCPGCGLRLQLDFDTNDIRTPPAVEPTDAYALAIADYDVRFRLPNSQDLAALPTSFDTNDARRFLLDRCLLQAVHGNQEQSIDQLPDQVLDAMVKQRAESDPQAQVQLDLTCPQCDCQWQANFDIISFLWTEINAWAARILREVHVLASTYGWREADILSMSPTRRQLYLDMIGGT